MKNDLTVVVVNDFDYTQGGASKIAIETAQLLYENNCNVIFFSATHKENDYKFKQVCTNQNECLKDGIKGLYRNIYNKKVKKEFSKLLDTLDNSKTIIHIHGWTKSLSSVVFSVAKKKKFKIVLTVHDYFTYCPNGGLFNYKKNKICNLKPMSFKCKICNCDSRNFIIKIYRVLRQRIQNNNLKNVKGNCIYVSDFSMKLFNKSIISDWDYRRIDNPIDFGKEKFHNSVNGEYFGFLGRLSKEKGIDLFCEAITRCNLKGLVIGDGAERKRLEEKYPNITFVGWKKSSEVKEELKKVKALLFTSLWYEAMGMTSLEAQSMGIPIIVGDNCATSDYVVDGKNGLLFKMGDVDDLVDKLKKCNNNLIKKMSDNSYEMYWKNPFSKNKYINELTDYYSYIIKGK